MERQHAPELDHLGSVVAVMGSSRLDDWRRYNATQHPKHLIDGILKALPAFVHDVDTFGSQMTDLETIISLCNCCVDLVSAHF
jgi:hypothetical protein